MLGFLTSHDPALGRERQFRATVKQIPGEELGRRSKQAGVQREVGRECRWDGKLDLERECSTQHENSAHEAERSSQGQPSEKL